MFQSTPGTLRSQRQGKPRGVDPLPCQPLLYYSFAHDLLLAVLRWTKTRRFRVVSEVTDGPVLDFLNRLVNHRKRNEKPFPRLHLPAEAILQFHVQSSTAEDLVQQVPRAPSG